MPPDRPSEPWFSFLDDLDALIPEPVDLHCLGGFIVSQHYGLNRETVDLDVITGIPVNVRECVLHAAGKGSELQRKHGVYIDQVWVAAYPDSYADRLVRAFPIWEKVRLWALEPHDLALTKLERTNARDIRDVVYLAKSGLINKETLLHRWHTELEPYLTGPTPTWHQTTLNMWIDACWPDSPES